MDGVLVTDLWERTSAKGTRYFSGFLGGARVVLLRDDRAELRAGVDAVWKLYVQSPRDRRDGAGDGPGR